MKVFKWLAILALILVLGLVVAWFLVGPTEYETEIVIDRPPAEVWSVFNDESKAKEWLDGLRSIETVSGEPYAVGSRFRLVFEHDGQVIEVEEVVKRVEPEKAYEFDLESEIMTMNVRLRFEPVEGGGTRIVSRSSALGRGPMKLVVPLLEQTMIEQEMTSYRKLKALIEKP